MSRADRFAVAAAQEAVARAACELGGARTGVFFGGSTAGMREGERFFRALRERGRPLLRDVAAHPLNGPGDAVARCFGVRGWVESSSSACASGALAIAAAADALLEGRVDRALAGGSDALCQLTYAGFNALRAVDERPCRPFRSDRAGLSLGEGGAVLVLERWEEAMARGADPLAVLAGWGSSCDAHHMTAPEPDGRGAATAIREALDMAGLGAGSVTFVNLHGTGTRLNDDSEYGALQLAFGDGVDRVPVTATKAAIGHLLGSAGAIEAVATVLATLRRELPPTAGGGAPDPDLPMKLVLGAPHPLPEDAIGLSTNFAFGGANAALIFRGTPHE